MAFTLEQILLNSTYCVNTVALLIKDILWLRITLMVAQSIMMSYAYVSQIQAIALWNGLFLVINSVQITRILLERRPITIPEKLQEVYSRTFSIMGMREFLYFWNCGATRKASKDFLAVEGQVPTALMYIYKGDVTVLKRGKEIARLHEGSFVSEMSFMTGEPASADVIATGEVDYMAWDRKMLDQLKKDNPDLLIKLQMLLGKDLAHKLKEKNVWVNDRAGEASHELPGYQADQSASKQGSRLEV